MIYQSQFIEMFGNPMLDEQKYPLKKLGDCCVINPKRGKVTLSDSDPVSFVPMPSVSEEGYLQDVSDSEYGSVKKGFTYFENGDVLFAKITPCMENGKGAIAHSLTNGIGMGSTEFHVLRPIEGKSNSYWLYTLTKLPEFREKAAHNMSGTGGQQRVRADFLENFMIGLPPIESQNDLESICRQADKSKFAGFKSQFIEMFGNPMLDEQKYPLKKLGDCCVINPKRGKVTLSDSDPVSFVPMPSVSEEGYLQDVSDSEYGSVKKGFTYFENGDVLFAKITPCMENGKGAIAHSLTNGIGMGSTEFHVLRPIEGKSNSYWLYTLTKLPEFREKAAHNMSGTGGQQRVRADFLENFMIGLPPIESQNDLESICRQADKSKFELKQSIERIDKVMRALMQ